MQGYREELGCWRYESEQENLAKLLGADSGAEEALLGRLLIALDCRKTSVLLVACEMKVVGRSLTKLSSEWEGSDVC